MVNVLFQCTPAIKGLCMKLGGVKQNNNNIVCNLLLVIFTKALQHGNKPITVCNIYIYTNAM